MTRSTGFILPLTLLTSMALPLRAFSANNAAETWAPVERVRAITASAHDVLQRASHSVVPTQIDRENALQGATRFMLPAQPGVELIGPFWEETKTHLDKRPARYQQVLTVGGEKLPVFGINHNTPAELLIYYTPSGDVKAVRDYTRSTSAITEIIGKNSPDLCARARPVVARETGIHEGRVSKDCVVGIYIAAHFPGKAFIAALFKVAVGTNQEAIDVFVASELYHVLEVR